MFPTEWLGRAPVPGAALIRSVQEVQQMTYTAPQIMSLGDVCSVVKYSADKPPIAQELISPFILAAAPAYDLDE